MLIRYILSVAIVMFVSVAALSTPSMAQIVQSTFDVDAEGWAIAPGADPSSSLVYDSAGGNPGGRIIYQEGGTGGADRFLAPTPYQGDLSSFYNGTFSFDVRAHSSPSFFGDPLRLTGGGNMLSIVLDPFPGSTSYETQTFVLNENAGWSYNGGGAPTQAQFLAVISAITSLQIPSDFFDGQETVSLDNVRLVAIPEPSSFVLFVAGLGFTSVGRRSLAFRSKVCN